MIRRLMMRNAGPFRGEHVLELGPKAYAVTARWEADPGRSNWGGKSFLFEMIDFALTGRLAKARRFDADGWITRGEREGAVMLELEDGRTILRERRRGQATQVRFGSPDAGKGAAQDAATEALLVHLGLSADDFQNVAYFEQKQMARLVLTEPEKRLDIVRGWLGLGKAESAEDRAGEIAAEQVREVEKLKARREALAIEPPPEFDHAGAERELQQIEAQIRQAEEQLAALVSAQASEAADRRIVEGYDELVARGKALAEEVAQLSPEQLDALEARVAGLRAKQDAKNGAYTAALRESKAKHKVSLGLFDGKCPVAEIACPATKTINADREAGTRAYAAAKEQERALLGELDEVGRQLREATAARDEARKKRESLEAMRTEAAERAEGVKAARKRLKAGRKLGERQPLETAKASLRGERDEVLGRISWAKAARETYEKRAAELLRIDDALASARRDVAIALRTRGVLRGAQRRVAERALAAINTTASRMLAEGGIDLSVELRWEREGKGLAKQCEECGTAFPSSAKVKECPGCGAARGQLLVQRLEFLPSDRSGAADDIAGVALQLAAGSWFLSSRGSPWATALLDEPLGACDRTNRRALSLQLVRLLGTGAFRQALVINHSPDTVELYPARIEVVVERSGARRLVVT